ncbi:hypothetical protein JCM15765_36680 [Paradesulfitobacterium aromaticivorans]
MRSGFRLGVFNSRGVHWIEPTGSPERELTAKYRQRAEEVENAGQARWDFDTIKGRWRTVFMQADELTNVKQFIIERLK